MRRAQAAAAFAALVVSACSGSEPSTRGGDRAPAPFPDAPEAPPPSGAPPVPAPAGEPGPPAERHAERLQWSQALPGACAPAIASAPGDDFVVVDCAGAASRVTRYSTGGGVIWSRTHPADAVPVGEIRVANDGAWVASGNRYPGDGAGPYNWTASLSADGTAPRTLCDICGGLGMDVRGDGLVLLLSHERDAPQPPSVDLVDRAGERELLPYSFTEVWRDVAFDSAGAALVASSTSDSVLAPYRGEVTRWSTAGELLWRSSAPPGVVVEAISAVAALPARRSVAIARLSGAGQWGRSEVAIPEGDAQMFLVSYDADGHPAWATALDWAPPEEVMLWGGQLAASADGVSAVAGAGRRCGEYWLDVFEADGTRRWRHTFVAACEREVRALQVAVTGTQVAVAGRLGGDVTVGAEPMGPSAPGAPYTTFVAVFER